MAGPYSRIGSGSEEYFRQLITGGDIDIQPEEMPGIMSRTAQPSAQIESRFSGISGPRPVMRPSASPEERDKSFLERFASMLGTAADDPEAVANAVLPRETESALDLSEWESLPPAPGRDPVRAALGTAQPATPEFEETASRLTTDLMRDFDLTEEQASAIVGNLAVESANFQTLQETQPLVRGSRGGYGYAQWTGPRRRAFESWAEENGLDPSSYEANYGYLKKELSETDDVIGNIGRNTIARLRETDNLEDATTLVMEYYLRPGIPHAARRQASAQQILGLITRQD